MENKFWLFKSEPDSYSIDHLRREKNSTTSWDGVRNYQARNFLRDQVQPGDLVFFYHSGCEIPAIVGVAKVVRGGYPDPTQFESGHVHFDVTAKPTSPRWFMVDIKFELEFKHPLTLSELKGHEELKNMVLLQKGSRLSIQPVTKDEWDFILEISMREK